MTSGYIPPEGQPDPDDILAALEEALNDDPRLAEKPEEEVARQLVAGGYLKEEPSPPLVAEALRSIEEESGNPT
jgi:hypothetical protein